MAVGENIDSFRLATGVATDAGVTNPVLGGDRETRRTFAPLPTTPAFFIDRSSDLRSSMSCFTVVVSSLVFFLARIDSIVLTSRRVSISWSSFACSTCFTSFLSSMTFSRIFFRSFSLSLNS